MNTVLFDLDGTLLPVSYTHLDVYKRQFEYIITGKHKCRQGGSDVCVCHVRVGVGNFLKQCIIVRQIAVSYTHLDVYKRQEKRD